MNNHNLLQESILGSLITWPEEINKTDLLPTDFTREQYRVTFQHLLDNEGGDLVTITTALRGKVRAEDIVAWCGHEITSAFLPRYSRELKEISRKIQIRENAEQVILMSETATSDQMIEKLESSISAIATKHRRDPVAAKILVHESNRLLKERYKNRGKIQGIPFGYDDLDKPTQGMDRGNLIILAARPSMGKTAFALNVAQNVNQDGHSVMFFSLEMPRHSVMDRLLSSRGLVQYSNSDNSGGGDVNISQGAININLPNVSKVTEQDLDMIARGIMPKIREYASRYRSY